MSDTKETGYTGENLACGYLGGIGYKLIDRNTRTKFGELDIILKSPDKTLVFVEVKTIRKIRLPDSFNPATYTQAEGVSVDNLGIVISDDFKPEDQMSFQKIRKFKRMAEWYSNLHPKLVDKNGYRLDLVAIEIYNNKDVCIRHYKNVT